jgi:hypothetical protein
VDHQEGNRSAFPFPDDEDRPLLREGDGDFKEVIITPVRQTQATRAEALYLPALQLFHHNRDVGQQVSGHLLLTRARHPNQGLIERLRPSFDLLAAHLDGPANPVWALDVQDKLPGRA